MSFKSHIMEIFLCSLFIIVISLGARDPMYIFLFQRGFIGNARTKRQTNVSLKSDQQVS